MSIKKVKKVIQVKKYEEQEVDEHYCDVCDVEILGNNEGDWYAETYCNRTVSSEWSCPLDLCSKCAPFYDSFVRKKGISTSTAKERYDGFNGDIKAIAKELIEARDSHLERYY